MGEDLITNKEIHDEKNASKYTHTELKNLQKKCTKIAVKEALKECNDASKAQREIFQAHVTDLGANLFCGIIRQYQPNKNESFEPIDMNLLDQLAAQDALLREKEETIRNLRDSVIRLTKAQTEEKLEEERKRKLNFMINSTKKEIHDDITEVTSKDIEQLNESYIRVASTIAQAETKISQAATQTDETIKVVSRAMKKPKTAIDLAMEYSPLKPPRKKEAQAIIAGEIDNPLITKLALEATHVKHM